jgi:hypothetical protein
MVRAIIWAIKCLTLGQTAFGIVPSMKRGICKFIRRMVLNRCLAAFWVSGRYNENQNIVRHKGYGYIDIVITGI